MPEIRPPLFFNFRGGLLSSLFWKKCQKVHPHYFSSLEGVYFLHIFSKNSSKCFKTAILPLKPTTIDFLKEIAILRHLEWFLEKSKEIIPPLKLKNKLESTFCHFVCYCLLIEGYILDSKNTEQKVFILTETTKESRLI